MAISSIGCGGHEANAVWLGMQKLHRDLPATTLYAYGETEEQAQYPGPTLEAIEGVPARVRWENHIHDPVHMFTVDPTVMWANPKRGGVPVVTHLHGAAVASDSDGHPEAWFTAFGDTGPASRARTTRTRTRSALPCFGTMTTRSASRDWASWQAWRASTSSGRKETPRLGCRGNSTRWRCCCKTRRCTRTGPWIFPLSAWLLTVTRTGAPSISATPY